MSMTHETRRTHLSKIIPFKMTMISEKNGGVFVYAFFGSMDPLFGTYRGSLGLLNALRVFELFMPPNRLSKPAVIGPPP